MTDSSCGGPEFARKTLPEGGGVRACRYGEKELLEPGGPGVLSESICYSETGVKKRYDSIIWNRTEGKSEKRSGYPNCGSQLALSERLLRGIKSKIVRSRVVFSTPKRNSPVPAFKKEKDNYRHRREAGFIQESLGERESPQRQIKNKKKKPEDKKREGDALERTKKERHEEERLRLKTKKVRRHLQGRVPCGQ